MGAVFITTTMSAKDDTELRHEWRGVQDRECHLYGHDSYGGHLGTVRGLKIIGGVWKDQQAAEEFIEETHEKWNPPMAVMFRLADKACPDNVYVIGGWMPS